MSFTIKKREDGCTTMGKEGIPIVEYLTKLIEIHTKRIKIIDNLDCDTKNPKIDTADWDKVRNETYKELVLKIENKEIF